MHFSDTGAVRIANTRVMGDAWSLTSAVLVHGGDSTDQDVGLGLDKRKLQPPHDVVCTGMAQSSPDKTLLRPARELTPGKMWHSHK